MAAAVGRVVAVGPEAVVEPAVVVARLVGLREQPAERPVQLLALRGRQPGQPLARPAWVRAAVRAPELVRVAWAPVRAGEVPEVVPLGPASVPVEPGAVRLPGREPVRPAALGAAPLGAMAGPTVVGRPRRPD